MSINGGCIKATLEYAGPIMSPIEVEVTATGVREGDFVQIGAVPPGKWLGAVRVIRNDVIGVTIGNNWPKTTIAVLFVTPADAVVA